MRKLLVTGILSLAMLSAAPALLGQHIQFHGTPGSVTDPGWRGGLHGPAASVTDPTFNGPRFSSRAPFGHPRGFRPNHVRPITPFFGGYAGYYGMPYFYDSSLYDSSGYTADQQQQTTAPPPQVIIIKDESAKSSDSDSRYGDHYSDGRENAKRQPAAPDPPEQKAENAPMTTLVYRDGHKSEVQNYAIVGGNLIDLTKSTVLKKIPLASLDLEATKHENEDNGVDFHTP
jgi:hypothetical protein